jgi:hypothetical protein
MKHLKHIYLLVLLVIPTIILIGCEKQEYFKSESTIQNEIQHVWHRVQISQMDSPNEYWEFKEGKININNDTTVVGDYSVKTTLTKVFVTTRNFGTEVARHYDGAKWQVIKLDSRVLIIAGEDPNSGALMQREFTRN